MIHKNAFDVWPQNLHIGSHVTRTISEKSKFGRKSQYLRIIANLLCFRDYVISGKKILARFSVWIKEMRLILSCHIWS